MIHSRPCRSLESRSMIRPTGAPAGANVVLVRLRGFAGCSASSGRPAVGDPPLCGCMCADVANALLAEHALVKPPRPLVSWTKPSSVEHVGLEMPASRGEATVGDDGLRRGGVESMHAHLDRIACSTRGDPQILAASGFAQTQRPDGRRRRYWLSVKEPPRRRYRLRRDAITRLGARSWLLLPQPSEALDTTRLLAQRADRRSASKHADYRSRARAGVHLKAGNAVEFEQFRLRSSQRRHCWSHEPAATSSAETSSTVGSVLGRPAISCSSIGVAAGAATMQKPAGVRAASSRSSDRRDQTRRVARARSRCV